MRSFPCPIHGTVEVFQGRKEDESDDGFLDAISPSLQRLHSVKQLGLVSDVYHGANHSKFQHSVGTYYLSQKVMQYHNVRGVTWSALRRAALSHSIGHTPLGLVGERAIMKAASFSSKVRLKLKAILKGVTAIADKTFLKGQAAQALENMLAEWDRPRIMKWISAQRLHEILSNGDEENGKDLLSNAILEYLMDPSSVGYSLLQYINRIDYVLRDLHSIGIAKLDLSIDSVVRQFKTEGGSLSVPRLEMNILNAMEQYLASKVYFDINVLALQNAYECSIAHALVKGRIRLPDLLSMTDESLMDSLEKVYGEKLKDVHSKVEEGKFKLVVDTHVPSQGVSDYLDLDRKLTNLRYGSHLENLIQEPTISWVAPSPHEGYRVSVIHDLSSRTIRGILMALARLETLVPPGTVQQALVKYLFQREDITYGLQIEKILREVMKKRPDLLDLVPEDLTEEESPKEPMESDYDVLIKTSEGKVFSLSSPHAWFSLLRFGGADAQDIASTFLHAHEYFGEDFLVALGKEIHQMEWDDELLGHVFEAKVFLRELIEKPDKDVLSRWVIPELVFRDDEGKQVRELDLLSIELLKGSRSRIMLVECTTSEKTSKHATDILRCIRFQEDLSRHFREEGLTYETKVIGTPQLSIEHMNDVTTFFDEISNPE
ncbi:MAG: hypothetical protein KAW84_06720 [Thermoplasmata archaeon]|nr:hypothetical protein [Thermoplasmata archaeon]